MILLAEERHVCEEAMGRYCKLVEDIGLLIHERKDVGSSLWAIKYDTTP